MSQCCNGLVEHPHTPTLSRNRRVPLNICLQFCLYNPCLLQSSYSVCVFKTRPLAFIQINVLILEEEEEMSCFISGLSTDRNSTVVTAFLCCGSTAAMRHSPSLQTRHYSSRLTVDGRSAAFIWTHSSILQNSDLHLSIFRSAVAAFWWRRRESVKSVCINQVLVSTSTFNKRV